MIDHLVHTDFKVVDKREPMSSVAGYLNGDTERLPIITDQERPWGVLNEKGLMRTRLDPREHVGKYTVGTGTLSPHASVKEALRAFANTRVAYMPVQEDGRLIGYVAAVDLLAEMPGGPDAAHLAVEVPILRQDQTSGEALAVLRDISPGIVPVVDDGGYVTGVLDRRHMAQISLNRIDSSGHIPAGGERQALGKNLELVGLMSEGVAMVAPEAGFQEVVRVLKEHGYAIVARDRKPLGVVTPAIALQQATRTVPKPRLTGNPRPENP